MDPLAEVQPDKTPYHYVGNNPIVRIDPTGMLDHDYKLHKNGYLEKLQNTEDNFDRIFNESGTDNIAVSKDFIDNSKSNGKGMIYPLSSTEAKHDAVSDHIFKFFASNTKNEYSLHTFKDTKTGKSSGFVATSFEEGFERAGGLELDNKMRSNSNLIMTRDIHSHPGGGKYTDSDYPSGFRPKGWKYSGNPGVKKYEDILKGDALYFNTIKKEYGNRVPNNFEIFVPKAPTVKIFYNDKNAVRTDNGTRY